MQFATTALAIGEIEKLHAWDFGSLINAPNSILSTIYALFLRIMAIFCIVSGLTYWAQLVGITDAGAMRFDLLSTQWRIYLTILAVILPVASLGLWLVQAWGVVLWVVAMSIEIAVYGIWAARFIDRPNIVMAHCAALAILILLSGTLFIQKRLQRHAH